MNENVATKAKLWADRIKDFQDSGLPRKEWCEKQEIAPSTLSYWIRKLKAGVTTDMPYEEPVFVKLPAEQEFHSAVQSEYPPVSIYLSEKIRIEVGTGCPEAWIAALLHALMSHA